MQALRIPSGWMIGLNDLRAGMAVETDGPPGLVSTLFNATHAGRRFNIDVEVQAGAGGAFRLTVTYAPWPRDSRGRRIQDQPLSFGGDAEVVHAVTTEAYDALIAQLEHWIARCTLWAREGN